jgi:hypothetical protein
MVRPPGVGVDQSAESAAFSGDEADVVVAC